MKRRLPPALITLVAVIAIISGGTWLTETRHYPVHQSPPSEWQYHPHLLAQHVLQAWQQHSAQVATDSLLWRDGEQPPLPATMVFQNDTRLMPASDQQRWFNWVARGGQLVLSVPPEIHPTGTAGSLIARLGITSQPRGQLTGYTDPLRELERYRPFAEVFATYCHGAQHSANCQRIACLAPDYPPAGRWPLNDKLFSVAFTDTHQLLWQPEHAPAELKLLNKGVNELGVQMVHWQWGKGQIWAISSLQFFDNQHLHYHDHAALLRELSSPNPLLWVNAVSAPTLGALLRGKGWPLLLAVVISMLLVIWRMLPRIGPRLDAEPDGPDRSDETVAASQWRWRHGDRDQFLAPFVCAIKQAISTQFHDDYSAAAQSLNVPTERLEQSLARLSQPHDLSVQKLTDLVALFAPLLNQRISP